MIGRSPAGNSDWMGVLLCVNDLYGMLLDIVRSFERQRRLSVPAAPTACSYMRRIVHWDYLDVGASALV